jgi:hypothetical protein
MAAIELPESASSARQFFKMKKRVRTAPGEKYYLCSPLAAARYINRRNGAATVAIFILALLTCQRAYYLWIA